jgi:addiction module HigA family antidote
MMHNPPHPGEFIREICLDPLNLTVTDAAEKLGVTRKTLSELLNGKSGISPEMAIRLAHTFNTSAESWLQQQMNYDLWHAKQNFLNRKNTIIKPKKITSLRTSSKSNASHQRPPAR